MGHFWYKLKWQRTKWVISVKPNWKWVIFVILVCRNAVVIRQINGFSLTWGTKEPTTWCDDFVLADGDHYSYSLIRYGECEDNKCNSTSSGNFIRGIEIWTINDHFICQANLGQNYLWNGPYHSLFNLNDNYKWIGIKIYSNDVIETIQFQYAIRETIETNKYKTLLFGSSSSNNKTSIVPTRINTITWGISNNEGIIIESINGIFDYRLGNGIITKYCQSVDFQGYNLDSISIHYGTCTNCPSPNQDYIRGIYFNTYGGPKFECAINYTSTQHQPWYRLRQILISAPVDHIFTGFFAYYEQVLTGIQKKCALFEQFSANCFFFFLPLEWHVFV